MPMEKEIMPTDQSEARNLQPEFTSVSPEQALAAVQAHEGPVLVDFDETLYLRNSTEDFIDSAAPATIAKVLLYALEVLRPWRLIGGSATRDQYRVILISIFFPWTWFLWRRRARKLGREFLNQPLSEALLLRQEVIIASIGFTKIIAPLLKELPFSERKLLACRVLSPSERRKGKLAMVERRCGSDFLRKALTITDSMADGPLLNASEKGCLVRWPEAVYQQGLASVYLPFSYLSQVKRPGQNYIRRGIVQDDLFCWILASLPLASQPATHVVGLIFLMISFWAVYEMGYVDNDRIAERFENDPQLSEQFFKKPVPTPALEPWIWAVASGLIALALLSGGVPTWWLVFSWASVLVGCYLAFYCFNRITKPFRPLLFPILQAFRVGAVAAVASAAPIAAGGLCAVVASRWIGYIDYRQNGGRTWTKLPLVAMRLVATVVFSAVLLLALGLTMFNIMVAGLFVVWSTFRARHELLGIFGRITFLPGASRRSH
jgi:hypothetical protein